MSKRIVHKWETTGFSSIKAICVTKTYRKHTFPTPGDAVHVAVDKNSIFDDVKSCPNHKFGNFVCCNKCLKKEGNND